MKSLCYEKDIGLNNVGKRTDGKYNINNIVGSTLDGLVKQPFSDKWVISL